MDAGPAHPQLNAIDNFASLFEFLPIGAYRSSPDGRQLRANLALVRLNGYENEQQMLAAVRDIAAEWYVDPRRRDDFRAAMDRDGHVRAFVSEVRRHRNGERIWVSENAHLVRDAAGRSLYYEGTVEEVTERVRTTAAIARSEAQLRDIADRVPGMVYRVHVDDAGVRRYSFVSAGVRALFDVSPEDVMREPQLLASLQHPDDVAMIRDKVRAAYAVRAPLTLEHRIVRRDGSVHWVQMTSSEIDSVDAEWVRVGVTLDVTERHRAEEELHASEARWKLALDSIGDGIWDWDLVSGREVLSPRCKEIYGLVGAAAEQLDEHHHTLDERTHPDDIERMRQDRLAHFEGRTPMYVNEHRVRHADGSWRWVLSRGIVISRAADGTPLRMIGTHTDITERRQAEALRAERDHAAAAQRAMTEFLSRVSHELRTPLNAILGFTQVMQAEADTLPRHRPWLREILSSGQHLLGLVNDILDLSGAQSGQLQFTLTAVPLQAVVHECLAMVAQDMQARHLVLRLDIDDAVPALVHADRLRLKQIVSNLLSNAVKYNRPGGVLALRLRHLDARTALDVVDGGEGLAPEALARLFTPFERLGAQYGKVPGAGLGLALSRRLAQAMDADIEASSTPGEGCCFTLTLRAA